MVPWETIVSSFSFESMFPSTSSCDFNKYWTLISDVNNNDINNNIIIIIIISLQIIEIIRNQQRRQSNERQ